MERGLLCWCWRYNREWDTRRWSGFAPQLCGIHQGYEASVFTCALMTAYSQIWQSEKLSPHDEPWCPHQYLGLCLASSPLVYAQIPFYFLYIGVCQISYEKLSQCTFFSSILKDFSVVLPCSWAYCLPISMWYDMLWYVNWVTDKLHCNLFFL